MPLLSLGVALSVAWGGEQVHRAWKKYPAIVQIETNEDIFAIGDVHGDYDRLITLLQAARLIDRRPASPSQVTWVAKRATLVFTGDLVDKGPHSLEVLQLVDALRVAAALRGGHVIILMGNHEAEFLADPHATKVQDFASSLSMAGIDPDETARCNGEIGHLLCSLPFGARVRDWFFSHAGNTDGRSLERLTADLQAGVDKDGYAAEQLTGPTSLLEARLGPRGPNGRSWFDSENPSRTDQQILRDYAVALGVAHIVQGHQHEAFSFDDGVQRQGGEMFQRFGLIFFIDTGMSEGIDTSEGAVLRLRSGPEQEATAICADGEEARIWDAKSQPSVGKALACRTSPATVAKGNKKKKN